MRTHNRISCFDGFLHHIAKFSGFGYFAFTGHIHGFNKENIAAHFGPGQTCCHTDMVRVFGLAVSIFDNAQIFFQVFSRHFNLFSLAGRKQNLFHGLAGNVRNFSFQAAHASLACIISDDITHGIFRDGKLTCFDGIFFKDFGQEMAFGNLNFFIFGITGQADNFHSVQKRAWHIQRVCRCHEHHVGQIIINFQIMVVESAVLLRVQNLQQGRSRIPAIIVTEFINFIKQEQWVRCSGFFHTFDNFAWH